MFLSDIYWENDSMLRRACIQFCNLQMIRLIKTFFAKQKTSKEKRMWTTLNIGIMISNMLEVWEMYFLNFQFFLHRFPISYLLKVLLFLIISTYFAECRIDEPSWNIMNWFQQLESTGANGTNVHGNGQQNINRCKCLEKNVQTWPFFPQVNRYSC